MKGIVIVSDPNGKLIPKIDKKLVKVCKLEKNEVLIRVKSVSVDPVDIRILQGHGQSILSRLSKTTKSLNANIVLIPGRDCAGIVEMVGENVLEFKTGDQVWAYSAPWQNGLMSEFSKVHEDNVAFKPENATFENSCSVAYAGLITWDALVNQAGLTAETAENKRVLIHLGSCAIGALAIQMVKLWGAHVTTTVPTLGLPLVRFLGADDVIVYSVSNFEEELRSRKKFDVVFNTAGSILHELSTTICATDGCVVSAVAPFPSCSEKQNFISKLVTSTWLRTKTATKTELSKIFDNGLLIQKWERYSLDKAILNQLRGLIESGKIKPIVEEVFEFDNALNAFERVASGDTVGRTVISFK